MDLDGIQSCFSNLSIYLVIATVSAGLYLVYSKLVDTENWEQYGVKQVSAFITNQRVTFERLINEHGDTVGLKQNSMILLTRDLSILKEVMVKDFNNFVDRPGEFHSHSLMNKSVFFLKGQDWRRIRHIITPSFSSVKLKGIMVTINEIAKRLAEVLEDHAKKGEMVPIRHCTGQYTGAVIARTAFGFKSDCLGGEDDEFLYYSKNIFKISSSFFTYLIPFIIRFSGIHGFFVNTLKISALDAVNPKADRYFNDILHKALQYRREAEMKGQTLPADLLQSFINAMKAGDKASVGAELSSWDLLRCHFFLETLNRSYLWTAAPVMFMLRQRPTYYYKGHASTAIGEDQEINDQSADSKGQRSDIKSSKTMTEEELIAQSLLIIFAGFETTTSTLQMCCYMLAKHPDVQEKLFKEIESVVKSDSPTFEELSLLTYMEQVLNETIRLYPPAPVMSRKAAESRTYHGITIPKNAWVFIPIFSILMDPKNFPEPEKFCPERFNEENKSTRDIMAFMPFGYGPRLCIGMRLAYQELKIALVHIVRRVRLEINDRTEPKLGEELKVNYSFNLAIPVKPITLAVRLRNS